MEKYVECHNCKNQYDCERTYLGGCTDGKEWQQEEKKLTDEEVIEALACCVKGETCTTCPYFIKRIDCVYRRRAEGDALDLIHRLQKENTEQKTEIERLTEERDMYADDLYWKAEVRKREDFITELTVENAELQKQVDELKANQVIECHGMLKGCDMVKQAVKETAKKYNDFIHALICKYNTDIGDNAYGNMHKEANEFAQKNGVEVE